MITRKHREDLECRDSHNPHDVAGQALEAFMLAMFVVMVATFAFAAWAVQTPPPLP